MKKHFVITTCGTSGDIFPFIEIARHLRSKNHKVSFITSPYFENLITNSGLQFIPFGTLEQYLTHLNDPGVWNPRTGFKVFWRTVIEPNMHCIRLYVKSLEPKDEVVILSHPALVAPANLARADRENLKVVLFYLYPTVIRSYFDKLALGGPMTLPKNSPKLLRRLLLFLIDTLFVDVGVVPCINKERITLGLTPIGHFCPHLQKSADLYVTLFPEWYRSTKPDYPKPLIRGNFVFYSSSQEPISDELAAFLNAGEPPILFTAGTGNLHARKFFEIAVDVARQMSARAVLLTKYREQLPVNLPESVLWQEYAPFNRILPRVSVIVHHGGIGTLAEACRAGVPQMVVPCAYDQFDNALIVGDLGIGKSIPVQLLTRRSLFSKLSEVQGSQSIKEKCVAVAANVGSGVEISQSLDRMLLVI